MDKSPEREPPEGVPACLKLRMPKFSPSVISSISVTLKAGFVPLELTAVTGIRVVVPKGITIDGATL